MPQVTQFPEITRLTSGDKIYVIDGGTLSTQITAGNADQSLSKNRIVNVECVNDLVNLPVVGIPDKSRVYVQSYYNSYLAPVNGGGDGLGGGEFLWRAGNTETEDSGRYFKCLASPTAGRWERLLNGAVPNIIMWGAKPIGYMNESVKAPYPGAFDSTSGIQRALNACHWGWAGTLYFPAGTYKITDTLMWWAQHTALYGDGCVNGTRILMDTGINKDILISDGILARRAHNLNPSSGYLPGNVSNDIPKLSRMSLVFGGNYYRGYPGMQNSTNSVLTISLPGETNHIDEVNLDGGKYALNIEGPQGPGLRLTNSTINAQGEACIHLAGIVHRGDGVDYPWTTGHTVGMLTVDNCSSDYRGENTTGFSFIKVDTLASPHISIKDLKIEGMYPSGIVNYESPSNDTNGSIRLDGLWWNQSEADPGLQNMTVVSITPRTKGITRSINTRLQGMSLYGVKHIIRDAVLRNDKNEPYILYPTLGRNGGLEQYQGNETIQHFGYVETGNISPLGSASTGTVLVLNNKPDVSCVSFQPWGTGWYRIMAGLSWGGNYNRFNHDICISNYMECHRLSPFSDMTNVSMDLKSISTHQTAVGGGIVTKARLFRSPIAARLNPNLFNTFLDIFVGNTGYMSAIDPNYQEGRDIRIHLDRMNDNFGFSTTIALNYPIFLSGVENVYETTSCNYAEVDLTKAQDRSNSWQTYANNANTTLLQQDVHLFVNSNREVRLFDGGVKTEFVGGGYSTQAVGKAIFYTGRLSNIILSNSGAGYGTSPSIVITPMTPGYGVGAYASGEVIGGKIKVHIISGGYNYRPTPTSDSDGVSLTGVQNNSVTTSKIVDLNVTTAKIADSNVTTAKIADVNVTYAKIATSAVSGTNIADNGISTSKILDRAITPNKIDITGLSRLITSDSVSSSVRRLMIQNNPSAPTTQVLITADEIVLKNNSGQSYLANSPVINLNIDTAGLGGLDNSSKANNTWYGIWGIYNSGSNLTSGVLSRADGRNFNYLGTSSSDGIWGFGPVMPGTYTYKALLGHAYHKVAAFDTFLTQDRRTYINDTILFSSKGVNTSKTYQFYQTGIGAGTVNLTGIIPANSIRLFGNFGSSVNNNATIAIAATSGGLGANIFAAYNDQALMETTGIANAGFGASTSYEIPLTGRAFWWKSTDTTARNIISVNGYEI